MVVAGTHALRRQEGARTSTESDGDEGRLMLATQKRDGEHG